MRYWLELKDCHGANLICSCLPRNEDHLRSPRFLLERLVFKNQEKPFELASFRTDSTILVTIYFTYTQ